MLTNKHIIIYFIGTCIEGDVRLSSFEGYDSSTDYVSGEVQVCVNEVFGSVCDTSWDNQDASVVCSQLGFPPYGNQCIECVGIYTVSTSCVEML